MTPRKLNVINCYFCEKSAQYYLLLDICLRGLDITELTLLMNPGNLLA